MSNVKHRIPFSTLMKQSKKIYYIKYFRNNWNNIKSTWEGIKTIISIKNITTIVPHSVEFNNRTITDPTAMSNVFNNYFFSLAKKTNSNIKLSPKHYTDYLSYTNTNTFLLTPILEYLLLIHIWSKQHSCKNFKTTEKWHFSTIKWYF